MPNNYILLETIALTATNTASVTFDNLPTSGYTDLKIVMSARTAAATTYTNILISFNGNTTSFSSRELYGAGSSVGSGNASGAGGGQGILYMNSASSTANTFGNGEIYIPNYRSTNAKSYSGDSVVENNATLALDTLKAGLWNPGTQAPITSITLTPDGGNSFVANSTFSLYGIAALGTTPVTAPKATGGNIVANDGTYWYHAFTSSGNFVPQTNLTADILQIAGGGGGGARGNRGGGGGGAGGLLAFTSQALTAISYNVTVGGGGAGGSSSGSPTFNGTIGSNSQFASLTASVGGGAGDGSFSTGGTGGSGGGAAPTGTGGAPTSGQGFAGGGGSSGGIIDYYGAGGGGGATAAGSAGTQSTSIVQTGGNGGAGSSAYSSWAIATGTGASNSYAGGGGGGAGNYNGNNNAIAGTGGVGGGGAGSGLTSGNGAAGITNTGGGGGGSNGGTGGAGGSGIIIIRYPIA